MSLIEHQLLAILAPKSTDRSERYCARLDEHLATLRDDRARAGFLLRELANWQERYRVWARDIDNGTLPLDGAGPTASDFVITITEIGIRQAQYQPAPAPAPTYETQGSGYDSGASGHELQGRQPKPVAP